MLPKLSLEKIEAALERAKPEEQRRFLTRLPHLLKLHPDDTALLKLAEPSFDFWNNPEDAIYDYL